MSKTVAVTTALVDQPGYDVAISFLVADENIASALNAQLGGLKVFFYRSGAQKMIYASDAFAFAAAFAGLVAAFFWYRASKIEPQLPWDNDPKLSPKSHAIYSFGSVNALASAFYRSSGKNAVGALWTGASMVLGACRGEVVTTIRPKKIDSLSCLRRSAISAARSDAISPGLVSLGKCFRRSR